MNVILAVLVLTLASASASTPAPTPPAYHLNPGADPASPELIATIAARDRELFAALFDNCIPGALPDLVTADFEFFHDKWGQIADSRENFAEQITKQCARQASGEDFRARRELDEPSVKVYVLNNYGALHMGRHRFYMLTPGQPDKLTEASWFINLWKLEPDGKYRLARVISYNHELAPQ